MFYTQMLTRPFSKMLKTTAPHKQHTSAVNTKANIFKNISTIALLFLDFVIEVSTTGTSMPTFLFNTLVTHQKDSVSLD